MFLGLQVSFHPETSSGAERLGDFICISLSASYSYYVLLATALASGAGLPRGGEEGGEGEEGVVHRGSVFLRCPSLVIRQAVLSRYAGCRTAPMGTLLCTQTCGLIWCWVVFYGPAITSVASLVPRPPPPLQHCKRVWERDYMLARIFYYRS